MNALEGTDGQHSFFEKTEQNKTCSPSVGDSGSYVCTRTSCHRLLSGGSVFNIL